ncbi:bacterioferritin-associated ferredoxin [Shewanella sp. NIFS-20-20]|uniref:bacterioferritin-associated ferredoxin n=1 Tax=Shewanella sp. NIFS-20-20 TaxID=2853806 RepID=UPI001C437392|nr:bacterioferritin-associated ferredoxin [Shewanella sp. NIFS-20-20]MBV7317045.1 bacterioferritin-associated ferredoxin [Shewanella sp. NIFS-20-20]
MFVCLCNGITDTQIKHAVASGDTNLLAVRQRLGVADQCGKCASMAHMIIQQQLAVQGLDLSPEQALTDNFYEVA